MAQRDRKNVHRQSAASSGHTRSTNIYKLYLEAKLNLASIVLKLFYGFKFMTNDSFFNIADFILHLVKFQSKKSRFSVYILFWRRGKGGPDFLSNKIYILRRF